MGLLVRGEWKDQWYDTDSNKGEFVRSESQFRNWITPDGSAGPAGKAGFKAEESRYHLYVSLACPWAHRTLIFRKLKGLEEHISVSVVHPHMLENGWEFGDDSKHSDDLYQKRYLYEIYLKADAAYSGRVTVPVLWDRSQQTIVNNESAEIIRMLNSAFDGLGAKAGDYYPETLRPAIDEINAYVYERINNGVYRCGFATTQAAYEKNYARLFEGLDHVEDILSKSRYLVGDTFTEADVRLFTTLVRFDPVYFGHFKCNARRIEDYANLSNYLREIYQIPGVAQTVNFAEIKGHYYHSHRTINPTGIVPLGPDIDYTRPHDRERLPAARSI